MVAQARTQAQSWTLRCPHCGRSKLLSEVGGFRLGAASLAKRVLGWCVGCQKSRWVIVDREDPDKDAVGLPFPDDLM